MGEERSGAGLIAAAALIVAGIAIGSRA
jgi:hypothetical protein